MHCLRVLVRLPRRAHFFCLPFLLLSFIITNAHPMTSLGYPLEAQITASTIMCGFVCAQFIERSILGPYTPQSTASSTGYLAEQQPSLQRSLEERYAADQFQLSAGPCRVALGALATAMIILSQSAPEAEVRLRASTTVVVLVGIFLTHTWLHQLPDQHRSCLLFGRACIVFACLHVASQASLVSAVYNLPPASALWLSSNLPAWVVPEIVMLRSDGSSGETLALHEREKLFGSVSWLLGVPTFLMTRLFATIIVGVSGYMALPRAHVLISIFILGTGAFFLPGMSVIGQPAEATISGGALLLGVTISFTVDEVLRRSWEEKRLRCEAQARALVAADRQRDSEAQAEQVERENKLEQAFFAMTCHEVRNPLNGTVGCLRLAASLVGQLDGKGDRVSKPCSSPLLSYGILTSRLLRRGSGLNRHRAQAIGRRCNPVL